MNRSRLSVVVACAWLGAACDPSSVGWWQWPDGHNGHGGHGGGGAQHDDAGSGEPLLTTLPLSEAPAPSDRFSAWTMFWGTLETTAPGFAVGARDELTLGLDANHRPRYISWKTLPSFPKTFGDEAGDFPMSGSKRVTPVGYNVVWQATVLDADAPTADHFLLRTQLVSEDGLSNYTEYVEGWARDAGWEVHYNEQGKFFGATLDATGAGFVSHGEQGARVNTVWSAPVEVVSFGFVGGPVDHMTVSLSDAGQLRSFEFGRFVRPKVTFGDTGDVPLSGTRSTGDLTVAVEPAIAASPEHFVLRYHLTQPSNMNDFIEGIEGTRAGDSIEVRYFINGKLFGASIQAHAAGTLLPAAMNP